MQNTVALRESINPLRVNKSTKYLNSSQVSKQPIKMIDSIFLIITQKVYLLDPQGKVTMLSVVQSNQNSNASKIVCISSLSSK